MNIALAWALTTTEWERWARCRFNPYLGKDEGARDLMEAAYGLRPGDTAASNDGPTVSYKVDPAAISQALWLLDRLHPRDPSAFDLADGVVGALGANANEGVRARTVSEIQELGRDEFLARFFLGTIGPLRGDPLTAPLAPSSPHDLLSVATRPGRFTSVESYLRELERIALCVQLLRAARDRVDLAALVPRLIGSVRADPALIQSLAERESDRAADAQSENLQAALVCATSLTEEGLGHLKRPLQVQTGTAGELVDVPSSLGEIIWLILHQALSLVAAPGRRADPLLKGFCHECGRPVVSPRPRKRGGTKRVFCDPPRDSQRSVCKNRYFSRQGKRRERARAAQTT